MDSELRWHAVMTAEVLDALGRDDSAQVVRELIAAVVSAERERDALRTELDLARLVPPPWPFDDR